MDQYNDPCGAKLEKIAAAHNLPVNLADMTFHNRSLDKVASSQFAYPEARLFPVHTPEDTLMSAVFFLNKKASFGKDKDEEVHDVIKAASIAHNVVEDYQRLAHEAYAGDLMKTASAPTDYALDVTVYDERIRAYPMNSPEELMKSAEVFVNECDKLSARLKKEAALNLCKKATRYGLDLNSDKIDAYAGLRGVDLQKAAELMLYRAKRSKHESLKTVMVKAAQAMLVLPEGQLDFEKIASFIDHYDDVVGTSHLVRRGTIPDGHNTIFNKALIEKTAGVKLAGKEFTEEDFKNLPIEKYAEALGQDFVKAASSGGSFDYGKAIDIASTLPLPEAQMLSEYMSGHTKQAEAGSAANLLGHTAAGAVIGTGVSGAGGAYRAHQEGKSKWEGAKKALVPGALIGGLTGLHHGTASGFAKDEGKVMKHVTNAGKAVVGTVGTVAAAKAGYNAAKTKKKEEQEKKASTWLKALQSNPHIPEAQMLSEYMSGHTKQASVLRGNINDSFGKTVLRHAAGGTAIGAGIGALAGYSRSDNEGTHRGKGVLKGALRGAAGGALGGGLHGLAQHHQNQGVRNSDMGQIMQGHYGKGAAKILGGASAAETAYMHGRPKKKKEEEQEKKAEVISKLSEMIDQGKF